MRDLNEDTITDAVLGRFAQIPDRRLKVLVQPRQSGSGAHAANPVDVSLLRA